MPPDVKRQGRLRRTAVLILLLGIGAAALVYCTGNPPPDYSDDPATARAYKTGQRNVEINFGQLGLLLNDFMEELKHPGVQAGIILLGAAAAASGCLYFSAKPRVAKSDDMEAPVP